MTKARDIADFKFENIVDTGTEGTKIASGTTAQRGSTAGQLRFNSETNLAEYYTGTVFKAIDSPPIISSIDTSLIDSNSGTTSSIVITGSNFQTGATVTFIPQSGSNFNANSTTVDSDTQITAVVTDSNFVNANEPYSVKVENASGLSVTLSSAINVDTTVAWQTASGSLGSIYDEDTGTHFTVSATDADSDTITYSVLSGSLPAGLSLDTNTGAISGDPTDVSTSTTSTFTLRASTPDANADREFSIIVNPTLSVEALIVAGGGGGGTGGGEGGGGGAGGLVYYGAETPKTPNGSALRLTAGQTYTVSVGGGGNGSTNYNKNGTNGGNSSFTGSGISTITAIGGGKGGTYPDNCSTCGVGDNGGSGGGGGGNFASGGNHYGGTGTSGQGNDGGDGGRSGSQYAGGGGGGAGQVGEVGYNGSFRAGNGGNGLQYSISGSATYYAGGGGGHTNGGTNGNGGLGGGGNDGSNGGTNLGGGGGSSSANGGSGVVILKMLTSRYTGTTTGSPTVTTSGSYTIMKFTGSGSYTA